MLWWRKWIAFHNIYKYCNGDGAFFVLCVQCNRHLVQLNQYDNNLHSHTLHVYKYIFYDTHCVCLCGTRIMWAGCKTIYWHIMRIEVDDKHFITEFSNVPIEQPNVCFILILVSISNSIDIKLFILCDQL